MIHLDDITIAGLLDPEAVTEVVIDAFAAWGRGEAATTQRVRAAAGGAMASAMAAALPTQGVTGGKLYATKDGRFTFLLALYDLDGALLCTLDGDALTRLRTPPASALAIRRLAAPGARVAALLGAGRQGWLHLCMLAAELPLDEVRIWDQYQPAVDDLVQRAAESGIPARSVSNADAAVRGADVVVTVTSATAPLFGADLVSDRTLICAIGATKYDRCEIGPDVVAACGAVVCDDVTGSKVECGDLIQAAHRGDFDWDRAIELHAVAAGTVSVPRAGSAPVLFETQGVALQDVAAAGLAWRRYQESERM